MGKLYRIKRQLEKKWENYKRKKVKPNKNALWIFGMQKSGTSAIAALLAHRAGKTVTIDTPLLWTPYIQQLKSGKLLLSDHINSNPYDFSKDIIKEPNATFIFKEVKLNFKLDKYVVIIRNPLDTIRSILNRLNLPGDKSSININHVDPKWRFFFKNKGVNYIDDLCDAWNLAYSNDEMIYGENCITVKYEDFNNNKSVFIDDLIFQLNLESLNSIEKIKNKDFQPKGMSEINLEIFFGANYSIIENKCKIQSSKFDYF
jgi:hypothetical protein